MQSLSYSIMIVYHSKDWICIRRYVREVTHNCWERGDCANLHFISSIFFIEELDSINGVIAVVDLIFLSTPSGIKRLCIVGYISLCLLLAQFLWCLIVTISCYELQLSTGLIKLDRMNLKNLHAPSSMSFSFPVR